MLDNLETLDDETPPSADHAMLARVRGRADRLRHRNRLAGAGVIVTLLALVAGVSAIARGSSRHVQVITPTPTTRPSLVAEGTLPNGLRVRTTLLTPTVQLGDEISVRTVATNGTGKAQIIGVGSLQCVLRVGPVLRDAQGNDVADGIRTVGCDEPGQSLAPGRAVSFTTALPTQPVYLPRGATRGRFELRLESGRGPRADPPSLGSIGPVPLEVVAPDITARLIVRITTVHPTGTILGTLELDNHGSAVHVLCDGVSYVTDLYVNGELIEPGLNLGGRGASCRNRSDMDIIPPGVSRHPFSVYAQYDSCTSAGKAHPSEPACGSPPMIPPLPAGRYEIRFRGSGPLSSVHAEPIPIRVVDYSVSLGSQGLPRITGTSASGARAEFEQLYYSPGAYVVALANRGATVTGIYSSGPRLVIQILPGPGAEAARRLVRSLFEHPEFVTVEPVAPTPQ